MAITELQSQVIKHLEFVGYEVHPVPDAGTEKMKVLRAERLSGGSIHIVLVEGMVDFAMWYSVNDFAMANRQGFLEVLNEINGRFNGKYYIGKMGETQAFFRGLQYFGPYDKKAFGQFVSLWQDEGHAIWRTEIDKFVD